MNTRQIVAKNTVLQILLSFFNLGVGFYSISIIARYLGRTGFGKYGFISSFYFYFITLLNFGILPVTLREIVRERQKAGLLLSNLITLKLFLSIFLSFVAVATVNIFPFPNDLRLALSLYAPILSLIALESIQTIFEVDLQYEYLALSSFFWRISSLLFVILVVRLNLGLAFIVIGFLLAEVIKYIVLYICSKHKINIRLPTIDIKLWIKLAKEALPIGITAVLVAIVRNTDVMILTRLKGFAEVGLYVASCRLYDMSLGLPLALMGSVFPLMSKYYKHDFSALKRIHQENFDILSVCAILLAVLVLVLADKLVILLFGAEFIKSAASLRILIISSLFIYLVIGSGTLLIAVDRQTVNMWFYLLGAPLNIVLNLILIPRFGFIGAAMSNVTVMFLITALTFYFVSVKLKMPLEITKFKMAITSGLVTLAVLFYLRHLPLFISMPIVTLLYISLVIFLKAIDRNDIILLVKGKIR